MSKHSRNPQTPGRRNYALKRLARTFMCNSNPRKHENAGRTKHGIGARNNSQRQFILGTKIRFALWLPLRLSTSPVRVLPLRRRVAFRGRGNSPESVRPSSQARASTPAASDPTAQRETKQLKEDRCGQLEHTINE